MLTAALLASCAQADEPERAAPAEVAVAPAVETADPKESNSSLPAEPEPQTSSPCQIQDGKPLNIASIKAIGTEPFWGARTEGRCVTYSTPEDQAGTRVWTKVEIGAQGTVWIGALRGKQFELTVKPAPGCSDGMSDKSYPLSAALRVDGEVRSGCAEPL